LDINNFHRYFFTDTKVIINVFNIVISNLTNMNKACFAFFNFNKSTKISDTGYLSLQLAAYFD